MTIEQIKTQLMKAFDLESPDSLAGILQKTDLGCKEELIHATAVIWSYGCFYPTIHDRSALLEVLGTLDEAESVKVFYEADRGFGTYCA